jgi:hypothetical protein
MSGFRQALSSNIINWLLSLFSQSARTTKSSIIKNLAFLLASLMMAGMAYRVASGRLDRASQSAPMSG